MSIIIRLQNLPLSAKTADIRKFFGGLRIPDGGVHILGGDNGDAFIAFMSDEDGRLAMRKDGGRIRDSRIKLFLSSRMEMQHEVEKITKGNFDPSFSEVITSDVDNTKNKSQDKRRRSRSPRHYDDWNFEESRPSIDHRRSRSPAKHNAKKLSPVRGRSRSPRRRSRSPRSSIMSKSFGPNRKSISPKMYNFHSLSGDDHLHFSKKNARSESLIQYERQAELERRITEEIEKNALYKKALREEENNRFLGFQEQHLSLKREPENFCFSGNAKSNMHHFEDTEFKHNSAVRKERLPFGVFPKSTLQTQQMGYVIMEGMDPKWNFREVQVILKGHYAPQHNIRMEMDDAGFKTGRAIVKLTNKDDFENILKKSVYIFSGQKIAVKACPHYIVQNYFKSNSDLKNDVYFSQSCDLCYILKGLPFTCKNEDVIAFFHGFEISDVVIIYGDDGQAIGTGFVSFRNWNDFEGAFSQNGKKIGHRYIEMLPCTHREMVEAKKSCFIPYSKILSERSPTFRRPICAILTGLPLTVTRKKILTFFSESGLKLDAIHLTLSKKKLSDGRAFIEFSNYLDFELALKFHGKKLDNHVVCVKQILYDEMIKILDSQKAKHYLEIFDPVASAAVPEKVPYLWEPPDGRHEKDSRATPSEVQPSFTSRDFARSFPPYDFSRSNYDPWYNQGSLYPVFPSNSGIGPYGMKTNNIDVMQTSMLYDNKQFMSTTGDACHSTTKYEENIKSSRLSPENEAALLDFLNRDRKSFSDRNNRRSRSPRKRNKKYFRPSRENLRIIKERETEYYESPSSSNPLHFNDDKGIEKGGCIVQLSNVDTSVGTRDLINFLKGFDFIEDTLIRRYTAENIPTSDVRVTFSEKSEAERAIRILNKRFLQGKSVNMFIV